MEYSLELGHGMRDSNVGSRAEGKTEPNLHLTISSELAMNEKYVPFRCSL